MILSINFASFAIGLYLMATVMAIILGVVAPWLIGLPVIVALFWLGVLIRVNKVVTQILKKDNDE